MDMKSIAYDTQSLLEEENFSVILKRARKNMGVSQREFSAMTGITQAQICRLENGDTSKPSKKTLKAVAPYVGRSYGELLASFGYKAAIEPTESYISKDGEPIDVGAILQEIYQADSELLYYFEGISKFGKDKENITLIKKLLTVMKKIILNNETEVQANIFYHLRAYINSVLPEI